MNSKGFSSPAVGRNPAPQRTRLVAPTENEKPVPSSAEAKKPAQSPLEAKKLVPLLSEAKRPAPSSGGDRTRVEKKYVTVRAGSAIEAFRQAKGGGVAPVESKSIANANGPHATTDIHELLKKEMFTGASAGDDNHFEKNRPSPDSIIGVSDHYVVLDSFDKDPVRSDPANGIFAWNFMVQGVTRDGVIGVRDKVETVIEMQIANFYGPFLEKEPYITNDGSNPALPVLIDLGDPGGGPLDSVLSQVPYGNFLTLQLKEIGNQKVSDRGGGYHYPLVASLNLPGGLSTTVSGAPQLKSIFFTPLAGWDTYIVTDPIKDVHGLTVQFKTPDCPLKFQPDCFYDVFMQVSAANTIEFIVEGHALEEHDRIFISGVTTSDKVVNDYLNANGTLMWPKIVGDAKNNTVNTFRLNPDVGWPVVLPPGTPIQSSTPITICVARRRVRIPMRLRGVVGRLTQYLGP